ncbi:MAG: hypothetical protein ABI443_10565 [Chthoniobacterales bacterium]
MVPIFLLLESSLDGRGNEFLAIVTADKTWRSMAGNHLGHQRQNIQRANRTIRM